MLNIFAHSIGRHYQPLPPSHALKTVLYREEVSASTLYWFRGYLASEFPMVSTTKKYFFLWSTDHDTGAGGIWWGDSDTPDFYDLTERGLLVSGNQLETPWLVQKDGFLYLFCHRGGLGLPAPQQTVLYTSAGGVLHQTTWTNQGHALGVFNDDAHTGYARVWQVGSGYIAHHLTVGGASPKQYYSVSTDMLTWTRRELSTAAVRSAGFPSGTSLSMEAGNCFERNGQWYAIGRRVDSSNALFASVCLATLNPDLTVSGYVGDLTGDLGRSELKNVEILFEGDTAHCYYKGGIDSVTSDSWPKPIKYMKFNLTGLL